MHTNEQRDVERLEDELKQKKACAAHADLKNLAALIDEATTKPNALRFQSVSQTSIKFAYHQSKRITLGAGQDQRDGRMKIMAATMKDLPFVRRLTNIFAQLDPDLFFTSLSVNCGGMNMHFDLRNIGQSALASAGTLSGGALCLYNSEKRTFQCLDADRQLVRFHGWRDCHFTTHFECAENENRYSIVAYIHESINASSNSASTVHSSDSHGLTCKQVSYSLMLTLNVNLRSLVLFSQVKILSRN